MKNWISIAALFIGLNCFAQEPLQMNAILKELNLPAEKVKTDLVTFKARSGYPDETIVVIPEIVEGDEFYFELNSHILITDTKSGKIKYKYFESSETNEWYSDAVRLEKITIDTAPYTVAKNTRAFGIRVSYSGSSRPNPYGAETISLFVVESDSLKNILKNYTIKSLNGEWDTNCEGVFTEQNKILVVSANQTNAYYDLLIKNTITERKTFVKNDNDCDEKKTVTTENSTLKYSGRKYQ